MKKYMESLSADFVVVGGGLAGVCAAVAAARNGASVILLQDRPVLGGNSSSEIRMWVCGAHGGAPNRESGLLEELKTENLYRNPQLKYTLWDGVIYSFVQAEKKIRLLLNTTVTDVKTSGNRITSVTAWNLTNYTQYEISGTLFADCSGDSILRLSGAEYRTGREARTEYGESHAPEKADGKTMGNSILIQLRKTKQHRKFIAPDWAWHFTDETMIRRNYVCRELRRENFWWMEFGGIRDTVKDADEIRHELLRIAYGTWEYLKNTPVGDAEEWELDWIGALPGKRESARYIGDHVMIQPEVEAGGLYPDVIAHGGWPMDDHNPEAFFTSAPPTIFHPAPSPFGIPYRSLYSRNIENLFFAGRNVSVSHMALSSVRVMATCSVMGQAVGTAAAIALKHHLSPRGVYEQKLELLQDTLLEQDQFLPGRTRKISSLAGRSQVSDELLRSGIDRSMADADNGIRLPAGGSCEYIFPETNEISSCRIVFDTDLSDDKKMRNHETSEEPPRAMPKMLVKAYSVSVLTEGNWKKVLTESCNRKRYVRLHFPCVRAEGIRLTVDAVWDPSSEAHIFAFEP